MIGWQEIALICLIVLLFFGSKRIPEIARSLGKASHEFKKAKNEIMKESEAMLDAAEKDAEKKSKQTESNASGDDSAPDS
ncbi:MAG: twin-arginine translocase TatA/TatE family subunit [Victivallales bacterium]|nr:twin-arginine translocase TatA/TatE family subunit [Victivallales bacterium]